MDIRHHPRCHAGIRTALVCAGLLGLLPELGLADGARVGQNAKPGEIVVIRNVAARPADRPSTAPGMALLVSASPSPQLVNTTTGSTGPGEIADAEIADLNAGPAAGRMSVQQGVQRSLKSGLGVNGSDNRSGTVSSNGISSTLSAPTAGSGAVGDSTRNIGEQVSGAVSQIPVLGAGR
jgi:hypothetical protein